MEVDLDSLKNKLKEAGQEHLVYFWDELEDGEKEILARQIEKIDFLQIKTLYENSKKDEELDINSISPIPYVNSLKMSDEEKHRHIQTGEEIIRDNQIAVVSMAGGQRYTTWIPWP